MEDYERFSNSIKLSFSYMRDYERFYHSIDTVIFNKKWSADAHMNRNKKLWCIEMNAV